MSSDGMGDWTVVGRECWSELLRRQENRDVDIGRDFVLLLRLR